MTKQELLTKLATDCATWREAIEKRAEIAREDLLKSFCTGVFDDDVHHISEQDWLAERERLLNKPSWKDAPEGATHLALDGTIPGVSSCASWHFYIGEPTAGNHLWLPVRGSRASWLQGSRTAIAIPAGYDWRDSLEERPV